LKHCMCKHLEVSEFSTHVVDFGGKTQVMTLQKCSDCNQYLTLDGSVVPADKIISREPGSKAKMRTVTVQMSSDIYEELQSLALSEIGSEDASKIVNEIIAMGIKDYKRLHH
ncbi:MAG: hypothetical protein M1368_00690, partial [Thaumarchaeota archaeon]|nr:hypothetical protein [Nitrososphaerota archaeon]